MIEFFCQLDPRVLLIGAAYLLMAGGIVGLLILAWRWTP